MLGSHGAGSSVRTTIGSDSAPSDSTRYPSPGGTSRKRTPPRELTVCVFRISPWGVISDASTPGVRAVTYTCSTLPTALMLDGDAVAPEPANELMRSHALTTIAPARVRPAAVR